MIEELQILHQKRLELVKYIEQHNLQEEKHYMKFLQLQDVNYEITILEPHYDFSNLDDDTYKLKEGYEDTDK